MTISRRFARDRFFADVERFRPTFFSAVPAIYAMLNSAADEVHPDMSSVRFAVCGAAPMPAEAIRRFEKHFDVKVVEGYGLSETTTASTINPLHGVRKPGTVGLPLPGQQVAVVDDKGDPIPQGERGEVVIAGPVVMAGYLGRPEETARTIVDGWLHTGDIGRFDEDGYLQIVDRIKDMIIRGGENVYPKEIENAFYSHPDVHEVAVVGASHDVLGEVPVAFVARREGSDATVDDLAHHVARALRPTSAPRGSFWSTRSRRTPSARSTSRHCAEACPRRQRRLEDEVDWIGLCVLSRARTHRGPEMPDVRERGRSGDHSVKGKGNGTQEEGDRPDQTPDQGWRRQPGAADRPALGQHGVNIMEFCKAYNAATEAQRGNVIPVEITVYEDRSFTFILKTPPAAELIKKVAGVAKGSPTPHTTKVAKLTKAQVREIAEVKQPDLNANDIEAASKIIAGTARSMGITVEG